MKPTHSDYSHLKDVVATTNSSPPRRGEVGRTFDFLQTKKKKKYLW